MGLFSNFLGTRGGRVFGVVPTYVDTKLAPGASRIPLATFQEWITRAPTVLWNSLNGLWALTALALYFIAPYDLSPDSIAARGPVTLAFLSERLPLWMGTLMCYISFWHITLYWLNWSKRPFIKDRPYNSAKILHNVFWSVTGVILWVCAENVFAYLWATGRLPYEADAQALGTIPGLLRFITALMLVPVWRNVHVRASRWRGTL
jgi:hypothetical protein